MSVAKKTRWQVQCMPKWFSLFKGMWKDVVSVLEMVIVGDLKRELFFSSPRLCNGLRNDDRIRESLKPETGDGWVGTGSPVRERTKPSRYR
jgi:hypothetical protein